MFKSPREFAIFCKTCRHKQEGSTPVASAGTLDAAYKDRRDRAKPTKDSAPSSQFQLGVQLLPHAKLESCVHCLCLSVMDLADFCTLLTAADEVRSAIQQLQKSILDSFLR